MRFKTLRLKQLSEYQNSTPDQPQYARIIYNKVFEAYELYPIDIPELLPETTSMEQVLVRWWAYLDIAGLSIGQRIEIEYDLIDVELTLV